MVYFGRTAHAAHSVDPSPRGSLAHPTGEATRLGRVPVPVRAADAGGSQPAAALTLPRRQAVAPRTVGATA